MDPGQRPDHDYLAGRPNDSPPPWYWYERPRWVFDTRDDNREAANPQGANSQGANSQGANSREPNTQQVSAPRPFTIHAAWTGKDWAGKAWRAELSASPTGAAESLTVTVGGDTRRFAIAAPVQEKWLTCERGKPKRPVLVESPNAPHIERADYLHDNLRANLFANQTLWPRLVASEQERLLRDSLANPSPYMPKPWPVGKATLGQMHSAATDVVDLGRQNPPFRFELPLLERVHAATHDDHRLSLAALALAHCGLPDVMYPDEGGGRTARALAFVATTAGTGCRARIQREAPSVARDIEDWWASAKRDDPDHYGHAQLEPTTPDMSTDARLVTWMNSLYAGTENRQ